jgi:osmotically-inducible protein OsmY
MQTWQSLIKYGVMVLSCIILASCMSAATTAASTAYSHRNIQNNVQNHYLQMAITNYIKVDPYVNSPKNVTVSVVNGVVLLTGQVPDYASVQQAETLARETDGVKKVVNFLEIGPVVDQSTSLNDTWITAKIKTKLITGNDVNPDSIKIITESGTVYLMGALPREEANAAIEAARGTDGVKKVVTVIYFLDASTS